MLGLCQNWCGDALSTARFQRKGLGSSGCYLDKEGKAVSTRRKVKVVTTGEKMRQCEKKKKSKTQKALSPEKRLTLQMITVLPLVCFCLFSPSVLSVSA